MPSALPASNAAPADAASPERWRSGRHPEDGGQDLDPHRQPRADPAQRHALPRCEPPRRPTVTTSMHPQHVPGHRLHHGPGQVAGPVRGAEPHEPRPGVVAPPRGTGTVEPGHGHHAAGAGRALAGQARQLVGGAVEQTPQPGQEGPGGGQPALEQPAPVGRPRHHRAGRRGNRALVHRHRHVGRWCPS